MSSKKKSKKKVLTTWDIALNHVGEQVARQQSYETGYKKGHLAGRIHEHAAEYESPGWHMEVTKLDPGDKPGARVPSTQGVSYAPQSDYKTLSDLKKTLGKVRYSSTRFTNPVENYYFDTIAAEKYAKTLKVGDSEEWDIDALGPDTIVESAFRVKITHLEKKK